MPEQTMFYIIIGIVAVVIAVVFFVGGLLVDVDIFCLGAAVSGTHEAYESLGSPSAIPRASI